MPSFYHSQLNRESDDIALSLDESQHALKARRLRIGDTVSVINGQGLSAQCELVNAENSVAQLKVLSVVHTPTAQPSLTIASALPKGDRLRTLIDMLAQLGVVHFIPLKCKYSVQQSSLSVLSKLQRYALEACKQSDNPWLLQIGAEHTVSSLLQHYASLNSLNSGLLYAHAGDNAKALSQCGVLVDQVKIDWCVAIGPEGGFSPPECAAFTDARVAAVRLGPTILRTETAAVAVAAQWSLLIDPC